MEEDHRQCPLWRADVHISSETVVTSLQRSLVKLYATPSVPFWAPKELIQSGTEENCLSNFLITCTQGWWAEADDALTVYSHAKRQTQCWWKIAIDDEKADDDLMELFRKLSSWTTLLHHLIPRVAFLIVHLRHLFGMHIRASLVGNFPSVCIQQRENHLS